MQASDSHENSIILEINGKIWQQVETLEDSGPFDRHFIVQPGEAGKTNLFFGDGVQGARPPSGARRIGVKLNPGSNYVRIILDETRMDADEDDHVEQYCGLYRGMVINNLDPENRLRLRIRIPEVWGLQEGWALPCLPVGAGTLPQVGKVVWVMFEHGDPRYPVWMGVLKEE